MIAGLGCDIIEISRIENSITTYGISFLDKIFTPNEQNYCKRFKNSAPHFAVRFAAKEAISKAFGVGIGAKLSWLDMDVLNSSTGKPQVVLSSQIDLLFNNPQIELTLSHCKEYAMAVAIWLKEYKHGT